MYCHYLGTKAYFNPHVDVFLDEDSREEKVASVNASEYYEVEH